MISRKLLLLSLIASLTLAIAPGTTLGQEPPQNGGRTSSPPDNNASKEATDAKAGSGDASQDADAENQPGNNESGNKDSDNKDSGMGMIPLMLMIGVFVLMYVWMGRGKKKRETQRREMLASLKKGDKITSIGGIVGIAIEVREDEVIVKVDENNNIRMRFARWAIRGVGDQAKTETPEDRR